MLEMLKSFCILAAAWMVGDVISVKTKALLSTTFIAIAIMLIGTWTGILPTDLVESSGMAGVAALSIPMILVHLGSTLSVKQLSQEWKTMLICTGSLITLLIGVFAILPPLIGREQAMAGGAVLYGGSVAVLIMTEALKMIGHTDVISFTWVIDLFQHIVGIPISLIMLRMFLKKTIATNTVSSLQIADIHSTGDGKEEKGCIIPKKYRTEFVLIFAVAVISLISYYIGEFTNEKIKIHPYVVCIIAGFGAYKARLLPKSPLVEANAYGFLIFALLLLISGSIMGSVTYELFMSQIGSIVILFLVGVPLIALGAAIMAKIVKWDIRLAIGVACSCLFGFPITVVLAKEASRAMARTPEEQEIFENFVTPKMLVAGIFTVSIVSGLVASIFAGML